MVRYVGFMLGAALMALTGCDSPESWCDCGATQICQDGKCLDGGFLTSCGNNAEACNAEAGYVCVGGPQYLDQGVFAYKVNDSKTKLIMNGDKAVIVLTHKIPASTYTDAYCTKSECVSDDDCPGQTYCAGVNTINEEAGANNRVLKVCLKREFCAPAKSAEDCYPVANRGFVQTGDDGSGYCTKTCSATSCPGDQSCVEGTCRPASGSCPAADEGAFCSYCLNNDDCEGSAVCNYQINGGARYCSAACTCENDTWELAKDKGAFICEPASRTDDPLVLRCVAVCKGGNSGCPETTPSGLNVQCSTRATVKVTSAARVAYSVEPTLIPGYAAQCTVVANDTDLVSCHAN